MNSKGSQYPIVTILFVLMTFFTIALYYRYIFKQDFTYYTESSQIPNQFRLLFHYQL